MNPDDLEQSLNAHVAERGDPRKLGFCDKLPPELQHLILSTDHSSASIVSWLISEGYEEATYAKVDTWRRRKKSNDGRSAEP